MDEYAGGFAIQAIEPLDEGSDRLGAKAPVAPERHRRDHACS